MKTVKLRRRRRVKGTDVVLAIFFAVLMFIFIFPLWQLLAISFNDAQDAMRGDIYFWPRVFTFDNYKMVFQNPTIYNAYFVTILRTVIGTVTSVLATGMFAYGLSKSHLVFRKTYSTLALITMFFGGGMIPFFILIKGLHLIDSFWVYIIPSLINVWNMLIMKAYFTSIPESLEESAKLDGCTDAGVFFRIVLPSSKPIIATMALFNGVGHWNAWFDAYMYITKQELLPLQTVLMKMVSQQSSNQMLSQMMGQYTGQSMVTPEALRVTTMMVAIGPIILIYPFLQKHFAKGMMLGAVKG